MRLIARGAIIECGSKSPATRASLPHWYRVTAATAWATTNDVQATFSKTKVLNAERVRFDIAGGDFRLICAFDFQRGVAFIKFVGTHAEYDRIDTLTVSQF